MTDDISRAHKLVSDLENEQMYGFDDDFGRSEQYLATELDLERTLRRIQLRLMVALEAQALPRVLAELERTFGLGKEQLTALKALPYIDVLFSPTLVTLSDLYEAVSSCLPEGEGELGAEFVIARDRRLFAQILNGTPKLIVDRGLDPRNEKEVRSEVFSMLLHVFPDTVREIPIAQVSKTYKPDLGVKSIRTAAEYKFADTAEELKKSLEGIYADMKGYAGSRDWTHFIATIYCTDVFMTPAQLQAECTHVGVPDNWEITLVTGRGGRRRAKAESTTPATSDECRALAEPPDVA